MSAQTQPGYDTEPVAPRTPTAPRTQPALRVVREAPAAAVAPEGSRRGQAATRVGQAGRHAQRSASADSVLAEAQTGISVLQLADQALSEVAVLLRRLRDVAAQAANRDARDRDELQRELFSLVEQVGLISREVRFEGAPIFDGTLAAREITLPGGGQACIDVAPMSSQSLGLEAPWGRATTSRQTRDTELISATGTLPSGTFRVVDGQVFGDCGEPVATYDGTTVDFGGGVSATFDGSLYFQDGSPGTRTGVFLLDSVLSVRTANAAEHAVGVIDRAAGIVTEQRLVLGWSRSQLAQAATELLRRRASSADVVGEVLDPALAGEAARGLAAVILGLPTTALAAHGVSRRPERVGMAH